LGKSIFFEGVTNFQMAAGGGDVLGKPSWLAIV
jgi:hypothetical protein